MQVSNCVLATLTGNKLNKYDTKINSYTHQIGQGIACSYFDFDTYKTLPRIK
jgi:hypothetical protein